MLEVHATDRLGPGWETSGPHGAPHVDHVCHWGQYRHPVPADTYGLVYAHLALEHVVWHRVGEALADAFRVLAPGGALEVWHHDLHQLVAAYLGDACGDGDRAHNPRSDPVAWLNLKLYGTGERGLDDPSWCRSAHDRTSLRRALESTGFVVATAAPGPRRPVGPCVRGVRAVKPRG